MRHDTTDLQNCLVGATNLSGYLRKRHARQITVMPGMITNLMALLCHTLYGIRMPVHIKPQHKESSFSFMLVQVIKQTLSVRAWPIIKSKRNALLLAAIGRRWRCGGLLRRQQFGLALTFYGFSCTLVIFGLRKARFFMTQQRHP